MSQPSRRTLWTGTSLALASAAFVSAMVLLQGLPSRGDAAPPVERVALAPAAKPEPVDPRFVVKRILPIEG
ncbi:MAG: hypothetical protein LC648_06695, partial [Novosphingobium sp.]|nr:hypothetical protein [Novosphingobium sp.]